MHIEPDLRLAIALHNNPGVYALLVGSGLSSAAGIPTGWQIILDLIRQLATAQDVHLTNDEETEAWYRETYNQEANYSDLLDALTSTSAERQALLRGYFEPTDEEREEGKKAPTDAHRAIARMVRNGNVQMILTTNFDRLLEQALQDEGVQPDIISSVDALNGAIPYVHSKIFVVKLHGDYRDTRLLNTETELSEYPDDLNQFLDEVFDRFGLVVCGWSATWDIALRNGILRAPNRRFTTFWLSQGEPSKEAQTLIEHRDAEVLTIENADDMFTALDEKLESLRDLNRPHPMSVDVAVATVKRYLAEERHFIRLHDLFVEETERILEESLDLPRTHDKQSLSVVFQQRLKELETLTDRLLQMAATLAYYDDGHNSHLLKLCIERLLQLPVAGGTVAIINLLQYPAMLFMYSAGIAAVASENYKALSAAIREPEFRQRGQQETVPVAQWLTPPSVIEYNLLPSGYSNHYTPCSDYSLDVLRHPLSRFVPDEGTLAAASDIMEYLLALTYCDQTGSARYAHVGPFIRRYVRKRENPVERFMKKGKEHGDDWALLKAGFFGGSIARLEKAEALLEARMADY